MPSRLSQPLTPPSKMPAGIRRAAANLPTERDLQASIVQGLERLGYRVLETGRWREQTRCPGCGRYHTPHTGYGNTPGCPDLFVYHPGRRGWVGLEIKAPGGVGLLGKVAPGKVREEQQALADAGMTTIVYSWEDALKALDVQEGIPLR